MAKIQILRALVSQRLTAAAEEIFGVVERTIAEYEEEATRSKQEIERQRKLLDTVLKPDSGPEIQLNTVKADSQHHFVCVCEEEDPPEQQERSPSLGQGEPPQIKEEQRELWSNDKEDLLQGLDEAETSVVVSPVCLRNEHGQGDQIQPSHLYLSSSVEDGEDDLVTSTLTRRVKSEPGEEDCSMLDSDTDHQPLSTGCSAEGDTDCRETEGSHVDFNTLKLLTQNSHIVTQDMTFRELPRQMCAPSHEVGGFFSYCNDSLMKNVEMQESDTDPDSVVCGPAQSLESLSIHLQTGKELDLGSSSYRNIHGDEISFQCHACFKVCHTEHDLKKHLRVHTREKPFCCLVCGKEFNQKENLRAHFKTHTGERPFKCCVCRKRFSLNGNLKRHMMIHTGEKPFGCSVCDKRFNQRGTLKQHMNTHMRHSVPL